MEDIDFLAERLEELSEKMSDPQVAADPKAIADIMREYKRLEPVAAKIYAMRGLEKSVGEAEAIITATEDAELVEIAFAEKEAAQKQMA